MKNMKHRSKCLQPPPFSFQTLILNLRKPIDSLTLSLNPNLSQSIESTMIHLSDFDSSQRGGERFISVSNLSQPIESTMRLVAVATTLCFISSSLFRFIFFLSFYSHTKTTFTDPMV
ncbi:unnamed protein product [Camellia sinensis]